MTEQRFGHYRLRSLLGRGGMGEVWEAVDTRKDREVALKVLGPWLAGDRDFARRFRRESALTARLNAPNIVPIHDYGEIDGRLYIDMPLIRGTDLATLLERGPLPPARAVGIVAQVARALAAAHGARLVHRDVKPSNILLTTTADGEDHAYLIDFGIIRALDGTQLSMSGQIIGTAAYMAPECFLGDADDRSDIYALGCVLHEALTGRPPFTAPHPFAYAYLHETRAAPRPSSLRAEVPRALDLVVARAMAKAPQERFATATELAAAARAATAVPAGAPAGRTAAAAVRSTPPPAERFSAATTRSGPRRDATSDGTGRGVHRRVDDRPPPRTAEGPDTEGPDTEGTDAGTATPQRAVVATLIGVAGLLGTAGAVFPLLSNARYGVLGTVLPVTVALLLTCAGAVLYALGVHVRLALGYVSAATLLLGTQIAFFAAYAVGTGFEPRLGYWAWVAAGGLLTLGVVGGLRSEGLLGGVALRTDNRAVTGAALVVIGLVAELLAFVLQSSVPFWEWFTTVQVPPFVVLLAIALLRLPPGADVVAMVTAVFLGFLVLIQHGHYSSYNGVVQVPDVVFVAALGAAMVGCVVSQRRPADA